MKFLRLASVNTRITLFITAIILVGAASLGAFISMTLRQDVQRLLTAQQVAASEAIAKGIDSALRERFQALEQVALRIGLEMPGPKVALESLLDDLPVFQSLFNGGTFITDPAGHALASIPMSAGRVGLNYSDRDYFIQVMATGRPAIGKPVIGKALGVPVVTMAAPIRSSSGAVVGVLAGVINIGEPSFLDTIQQNPFGKTGIHLLIDHENRMVITASDKRPLPEPLPPRGVNPQIDSFVDGFEGSQTLVNPQGVPVLAAIKHTQMANWYVAVTLPAAEAYAPVTETQRRMLAAMALIAAVISLVLWLIVRRQLAPLKSAARTLGRASSSLDTHTPIAPLPVPRPDEIGQLIQAFNQLIAELTRQRTELVRSELLYSTAFQTSPDAISITGLADGHVLKINESFTRILGWRAEDIVGRDTLSVGIWRNPGERAALLELLERQGGRLENHEAELVASDGRIVSVEMSATVIELDGERCLLAVTHDITQRQQAQRQIEKLSLTDPLTGLPNRRLLVDRLDQAVAETRRHGQRGALLSIDLDELKAVNDRFGQDTGDMLLRGVGHALGSLARPGDTVARIGGDEFVVVMRDLHGGEAGARDQALAHAGQLLEALNRGRLCEGCAEPVAAGVGVVLFGDADDSASDLITRADLAMYLAKEAGRNQIRLFDAQAHASVHSRALLESDLRAALATGQLLLHYQAQVSASGRVASMEALVRWQHPKRGMVSPGEFIPMAESSGLIVPLGRWVLEQACRQLAVWARDPVMAPLDIAVNVSSRQFQEPDFVEQVLEIVSTTGANPRRLKLELTESLLIDHIDGVTSKMHALKARGIGFSLDDFGTGFSSLAYLKRLPLDELKIDASFVRDIEVDPSDLSIAGMVVALGKSLGLRVLAEGVERPAQRALLHKVGCEYYQGYLFSRPAPAEAMEALVRERLPADSVPA